jgi:hypothetical protein
MTPPQPAWAVAAAAAFWIFCGALLYFAPTLIALIRHHPAWGAILVLDLWLAWTIVGWLVLMRWACAPRIIVNVGVYAPPPPPPPPPAPLLVAPDGRSWWDGFAWVDGAVTRPVWAIPSPNGRHWWSGSEWVPADASHAPPAPVAVGEEQPW